MNFAADTVQTQAPQFMDLGFLNINALGEISGLSTPATKIQKPKYGAHWSTLYHVFCELTAVGTSETKSDHDYNYKTEFQIWRENKEFEHQFFPDESTAFGFDSYWYEHNKRKNITFGIDSCWYKITRPKPLTLPME